jgi:hypothetical protein
MVTALQVSTEGDQIEDEGVKRFRAFSYSILAFSAFSVLFDSFVDQHN